MGVNDLDLTQSLVSIQRSGHSDQQMLLLTEDCLQYQKWCPYNGRGVGSTPVRANKVRNGPASADQGLFTQPKQLSYAPHVVNIKV